MKKTLTSTKVVVAEEIARMADRGKNVLYFFEGQGRMVQPLQSVNVDATAAMPEELDCDLPASYRRKKSSR